MMGKVIQFCQRLIWDEENIFHQQFESIFNLNRICKDSEKNIHENIDLIIQF